MSWRLLAMLTSDAGGDETERSRGSSSGAGMEWDRTGGGGRGLALCVGGYAEKHLAGCRADDALWGCVASLDSRAGPGANQGGQRRTGHKAPTDGLRG